MDVCLFILLALARLHLPVPNGNLRHYNFEKNKKNVKWQKEEKTWSWASRADRMTAGIMPRTPPPSMLSMVITFPPALRNGPCVEFITDFLSIQMVVGCLYIYRAACRLIYSLACSFTTASRKRFSLLSYWVMGAYVYKLLFCVVHHFGFFTYTSKGWWRMFHFPSLVEK